jgi:ABC-type transport system involved in cytochrome c biogenesis permease component
MHEFIIGTVMFMLLYGAIFLGVLASILPTVIALFRKHQNVGAIAAVNLLLGWTALGWVVALVWSLTSGDRRA